jgi:hypothetical protein
MEDRENLNVIAPHAIRPNRGHARTTKADCACVEPNL